MRGKLIVISAPSGSGKTTIAREIMKRNPSLGFSVSATTRPMRPGEREGKDYFFLSREEFQDLVEQDAFVEWEEIYGDSYGTLKREIDRALARGEHMLFDVDVKGALSIKRRYPDALLIFIQPPDMEVLKQRLMGRKTEDQIALARRLERVPMELEKAEEFNHRIVNDDLERAIAKVQQIVEHYLPS